jgi:predicted DCC family thiol-disulfide oxidoreductase YuxK
MNSPVALPSKHKHRNKFMSFWKQIYKKAFRTFAINDNTDYIEKNINLARILVGLGIFHSYLDMLGYSIFLSPENEFKAILVLVLSFLFTIGLLTPLICGLLIYYFADPVIHYLGTMVLIILLWGMLFVGVGRRWSIDAYLLKSSTKQKFIKYLYIFSLPLGTISFSKIRFFILFLFWWVCFGAMIFHFDDPYWIHGKTLQLVLATPYITDYYLYFQKFSQTFPLVYDLLCKLGLFLQSAWELLLFPLMFFRWGRVFVIIQGMAFFLVSLFILNLGYLPYYEICMWIFLFNYSQCFNLKKGRLFYDDRCNLCKKSVNLLKIIDFYDRIEVIGLSQSPDRVQKAFLSDMQIIYQEKETLFSGFSAYYQLCKNIFPFFLVFPFFFIARITRLGNISYKWIALRRKKLFGVCEPYFYTSEHRPSFKTGRWSAKLFSLVLITSILTALVSSRFALLGQGPVDVLNDADLKSGAPGIVLTETDAKGKSKRVVPFMDINGGRLSYLRNDLLYFQYSSAWQRKSKVSPRYFIFPFLYFTKWERKHTSLKEFSNSSKDFVFAFQKLSEMVGVLDSCLRQSSGSRYYRADLYIKKLENYSSFKYWGTPERVATYSFSMDMDKLKDYESRCHWAYNLPPGHLFSDKRIGLTDAFYKNTFKTDNEL